MATPTPKDYKVLFALLAGSGLRIGEALGLRVTDFNDDFTTIKVSRSVFRRTTQIPKTPNAVLRDRPIVKPRGTRETIRWQSDVRLPGRIRFRKADVHGLRNSLRACTCGVIICAIRRRLCAAPNPKPITNKRRRDRQLGTLHL